MGWTGSNLRLFKRIAHEELPSQTGSATITWTAPSRPSINVGSGSIQTPLIPTPSPPTLPKTTTLYGRKPPKPKWKTISWVDLSSARFTGAARPPRHYNLQSTTLSRPLTPSGFARLIRRSHFPARVEMCYAPHITSSLHVHFISGTESTPASITATAPSPCAHSFLPEQESPNYSLFSKSAEQLRARTTPERLP